MIQGSFSKFDDVNVLRTVNYLFPGGNLVVDTVISSYRFIISFLALPMRLFFRRKLGERAFSPFTFLISIIFYYFFSVYYCAITVDRFSDISFFHYAYLFNPFTGSLVCFFIGGIVHFLRVIKSRLEEIKYSYYRGDSAFFSDFYKYDYVIDKENSNLTIRMIIEPFAGFITGIIIFFIFFFVIRNTEFNSFYFLVTIVMFCILGAAISLSSLCIFFEEFGLMMRIRGAVLDLFDGEYNMNFIEKKREEMRFCANNSDRLRIYNDEFTEVIYEKNIRQFEHYKTKAILSITFYNELKTKFLQN